MSSTPLKADGVVNGFDMTVGQVCPMYSSTMHPTASVRLTLVSRILTDEVLEDDTEAGFDVGCLEGADDSTVKPKTAKTIIAVATAYTPLLSTKAVVFHAKPCYSLLADC